MPTIDSVIGPAAGALAVAAGEGRPVLVQAARNRARTGTRRRRDIANTITRCPETGAADRCRSPSSAIYSIVLPSNAEVAERQTHQLEGLAGATPWRFESSLPHHSTRLRNRLRRAAGSLMAGRVSCRLVAWAFRGSSHSRRFPGDHSGERALHPALGGRARGEDTAPPAAASRGDVQALADRVALLEQRDRDTADLLTRITAQVAVLTTAVEVLEACTRLLLVVAIAASVMSLSRARSRCSRDSRRKTVNPTRYRLRDLWLRRMRGMR